MHKKFVELLESVADIYKTSQIAYSLAQKGNTFRESFYMSVPKHYGGKILEDFHIHYDCPKCRDMHFMGVGIDVINNKIKDYKLYFLSSKYFLKSYLEPFEIDLTRIKYYSHYLVLRLDRNQSFESYKIDILLQHDDLKYFINIIDNYPYYDEKLKMSSTYTISIEIVENHISKINIYHRHYTSENKADEI